MILYRPQSGSLIESLTKMVPVQNSLELLGILQEQLAPQEVFEFTLRPYGYDPRIGWQTYLVLVADGTMAVGFTNGLFQG